MATIHDRIKEDRDTRIVQSGFTWSDIRVFRDYANGKQRLVLTEKQKELLKNLDNGRFCDNVCGQILLESTGRVQFYGWDCKNSTVKDWLDDLYKIAKIEGRQGDFHHRTFRDGNFALSVMWDNTKKRIKVLREDWWDGLTGVYLHYGDDGEVEYAVKEWRVKTYETGGTVIEQIRRTVYYEDRIERYLNPTAAQGVDNWVNFSLPEDEGVWPVPWIDENGEGLGIPFIHFPDVAKTYGEYGVSELDGGVIGFQDQLNDAQLSIAITIRLTGGQQYYATGVKPKKKDGSDEYVPVKVEPGAMHTTPNENAKFGVLPAGDIDKQISGYNLKLKRVSQMSATPLHIISGGDWPSGEALLRAEMPAVNKAWKQIFRLATSYIELATVAAKIHNRFKPSSAPTIDTSIEDGVIEAKFADPERRDAISRSIIVHNLAANISKKEAMRIMNYSEEKAQQVYDEIIEEGNDAADAMMNATLRGNVPGAKEARGGNNNKNDKAK